MTDPPASPWERMRAEKRRRIVWWMWLVTWLLLLAGLYDRRYYEIVAWFTAGHALLFLALNRFRFAAFPVQVRIVYLVWATAGAWVPYLLARVILTPPTGGRFKPSPPRPAP